MDPGSSALKRRFSLHGDAWTRILNWAVRNVPAPLEPFLLAFWSTLFYLLAARQRRAVVGNLRALFPRDGLLAAHARAWRVFWNFANTEVEAVHCLELGLKFDWEVEGCQHFRELVAATEGTIIVSAHMGSYDVGALLFAKSLAKPFHTVRAPESTPELQALKEEERDRIFGPLLRIHYNTQAADALGVELLRALQAGDVVAIQGDRLVGNVAVATAGADFGGMPVEIPSGPFALAAAARCQVYPLFIVRLGRRRYRLICKEPFSVQRERAPEPGKHPLSAGMDAWGAVLAEVARKYWFQWYVFEPLFPPGVKWPGDPRPPAVERRPQQPALYAPGRCTTSMLKAGLLLMAKLGVAQRRDAPLPGVDTYLSDSPDMCAEEATSYSLLYPLASGALLIGSLHHLLGSWPAWVTGLGLALAPLWLPVMFQLLLLLIWAVLRPARVFFKLPMADGRAAHWVALQTLLTVLAELYLFYFGEVDLLSLDLGTLGAWGAIFLAGFTLYNLVAFLLLQSLGKDAERMQEELHLQRLPENLADTK
jgi:lauroyl/myristoyl acyltransferase